MCTALGDKHLTTLKPIPCLVEPNAFLVQAAVAHKQPGFLEVVSAHFIYWLLVGLEEAPNVWAALKRVGDGMGYVHSCCSAQANND